MRRSVRLLLATVLVLVYFALGMVEVRRASITVDEGPHLAVGYATLRTGDYRLQPVHIHPPLANFWAAWPLLLQDDLPDPRAIDGWSIASLSAVSDAIVWRYPRPAHLALVGRVPILLWGVLLGALLFRWTEAAGGWGLLALMLYAFDPNLLAHGGLITTDMGAALFIFATAFALWRLGRGSRRLPAARAFIVAGGLLGLAQLVKVSTLLLVPLAALVLFHATVVAGRAEGWGGVRRWLDGALLLFGTAALVVWGGYRFQWATVEGWPHPLPAGTHLAIYRSLYEHYEEGHSAFLAGRLGREGWWWYFPFAFAVKTPLPVLLMAAAAGGWSLHRLPRGGPRRWVAWLRRPVMRTADLVFILPWLYAASSLLSSVTIGYRHLLPLLPFLFLGIGVAARRAPWGRWRWWLLVPLLCWLVAGTLRILPYPLTFFNEAVGGAANGYRYLVDSNLDWGQNLYDLHAWMAQSGTEELFYAHYSPARPEVYGIRYRRLPPAYGTQPFPRWNPPPGTYAIGATVLQGDYVVPPQQYEWFRARRPLTVLYHALFIYRVEAEAPPRSVVICADPAPLLDGAEVIDALGTAEVRLVRAACGQSFVYPRGGRSYLVFPPTVPSPPSTTPLLESRAASGQTRFRLLASDAPPAPQAGERVALDGPLTFLGYAVVREGEVLELRTFWEVERGPITRPLSLLAHLADEDGTVVAVADGLGFTGEFWQRGDRFVERHRFAVGGLPPGTYTLFTGAYWLDEIEPWPTAAGGQGRLALTTVTLP